jgi:hypothetical protein
MPRKPIDWTKCVIYKIECKDKSVGGTYVSHTTDFTNRKHTHKNEVKTPKSKISQFIQENGGWDNFDMIPLENYTECKSLIEATIREQEWKNKMEPKTEEKGEPVDFFQKDISESSKRTYTKSLVFLNDEQPITDLDFLLDGRKILKKITEHTDNINSQKSFITACSCVLSTYPEYKKAHNFYKKALLVYNKLQKEKKKEEPFTEKQLENWVSMEEIMKIHSSMKTECMSFWKKNKITAEQFEKLRDLLILSLYVLQNPRRNQDYFLMKVTKNEKKANDTNCNFLCLKEKKFIFNKYKTENHYGTQTCDISEEMDEIIKYYLKHHPLKKTHEYFLITETNGETLNNSNFITFSLNRILGKKIGVSLLRNIFLSNKFSENIEKTNELMEEIADVATSMGTSIGTSIDTYIKPVKD